MWIPLTSWLVMLAAKRRSGIATVLLLTAMLASGCSSALNFSGSGSQPMDGFSVLLGPVAGTGPRNFVIAAPRAVSATMMCAGQRIAWLRTTPNIVGMGVACANGGAGGNDWLNVPSRDVGRIVHVHIAAPAGTRWLLRVDGSSTKHHQV
jgi:hypothetical protein